MSLKAFQRFWFSKTFKKTCSRFVGLKQQKRLERLERFLIFYLKHERADLLKRQRCDYSAGADWVIYGVQNNS
jgi:hypothetical protein